MHYAPSCLQCSARPWPNPLKWVTPKSARGWKNNAAVSATPQNSEATVPASTPAQTTRSGPCRTWRPKSAAATRAATLGFPRMNSGTWAPISTGRSTSSNDARENSLARTCQPVMTPTLPELATSVMFEVPCIQVNELNKFLLDQLNYIEPLGGACNPPGDGLNGALITVPRRRDGCFGSSSHPLATLI